MALPKNVNTGRLINNIDGIGSVTAGGITTINLNADRRYHNCIYQCKAVNYTGGTALATTVLTGSGSGTLTVTFTATTGVPNALTIAAGGTG